MDLRVNNLGPKAYHLNPSVSSFATADLSAIGSTIIGSGMGDFYPYAQSATVNSHYDAMNGIFQGAAIDASERVAFGVFLTPDNDLGNMVYQVSGSFNYYSGASSVTKCGFFFGRKATNNTVVSSKASANNLLANFTLLPFQSVTHSTFTGVGHGGSVILEVPALALSSGYVSCFGFYIDNYGSAATGHCNFSIAMRKAGSAAFGVFSTNGGV